MCVYCIYYISQSNVFGLVWFDLIWFDLLLQMNGMVLSMNIIVHNKKEEQEVEEEAVQWHNEIVQTVVCVK